MRTRARSEVTRSHPGTLEIAGIHKRFGRTTALAGVSLDIVPGVTALLGPNGAGKSTLLQVLATIEVPDAGRLRLLGWDPADVRQRTQIRRCLGYLPQEPHFHHGFTAFEFVDYVAILKEHADCRARRREVGRVLEEVGLGELAGREIRTLSSGMRKRVALAQVLLGDPHLFLLDEPTAGLDPEQRLHLRDLISRLGEDRTVVLATHQIEHIGTICDRLVVLREGSVLWDGSPQQLAGLASGKVWLADQRDETAFRSWRTAAGHRHVGDPPAGANLIAPSIEDGYLLLTRPKPGRQVGRP